MPQMNGKVLADQLVRIRPAIKVIFMSGYTDDAIVRHGVLENDVTILQKPFSEVAMTRIVGTTLDRPERQRLAG